MTIKKNFGALLCGTGLSFLLIVSCGRDAVTLRSLLSEMTVRENLTYFPSEHFTHHQFSSYNRASTDRGGSGWFANNDMSHFVRVEKNAGRREFVMFDADGPGAIVRWWMTFYKAQNGIIRVYIDNSTIPVMEGKPANLLRGTTIADPPLAAAVQDGAQLGEEGRDYDHNFYVPLPFARHCKITYECDSLVMRYENEGVAVPEGYWWPDVFYNIGYRSYDRKVKVISVTKKELLLSRKEINEAGRKLLESHDASDLHVSFEHVIGPGDSVTISIREKNHAINGLFAELKSNHLPQSLRSVVIEASFDGNQSIWTPIGEFFGTGYSTVPHRTWMNQADGKGKMKSYWVMPFREVCMLRFLNYGKDTVTIKGEAALENYQWKSSSLYFGSAWHEYYHIRSRENGSPFDLNFIDIRGRGIYAGDQITLFNNTWKWWGEGDEKIFVDGEPFPSSFGTGSEDYYGYSFGRQESFSHPFLSQPVGTGNMASGPTVNMRHRSLDAIPFTSGISSNIELWHWADIIMNYALTSYFYFAPPITSNRQPCPESVRKPVGLSKIDFTLEEN